MGAQLAQHCRIEYEINANNSPAGYPGDFRTRIIRVGGAKRRGTINDLIADILSVGNLLMPDFINKRISKHPKTLCSKSFLDIITRPHIFLPIL